MNRQTLQVKMIKATAFTVALSITLASSTLSPVFAQAMEQDSFLPPEVTPVDPASQAHMQDGTAPGMVGAGPNAMAAANNGMQSSQDFRKALMNSLAGKGNYPQFNNPVNNSAGQMQPMGQPIAQSPMGQQFPTNNNQGLGQSDWNNPTQSNTQASSQPAQTQTLSGGVKSAQSQVPSRGGNSLAHGLGLVTSLGMGAYTAAMMRGPGAAYGLTMLGGGLLNYGYHSGFRY